jgi:ArsR family transcriptional regulator
METYAARQISELKFSQTQGFFATSQSISFARLKNFTPKMYLSRIAKWVFKDIIKFIKIKNKSMERKKAVTHKGDSRVNFTLEAANTMQDNDDFDDGMSLLEGDADIDRASRSLKAMSHPLRLKILCTLGGDEVSVQDIVDQVGTSQSNISQHLAILRDKGILSARKDANRVYYKVGDNRTLALIGMMRQVFCQAGD